MTSRVFRQRTADSPLPRNFEVSLGVAFLQYNGRLSLSLEHCTRDAGRRLRPWNLHFQTAEKAPETYGEALVMVREYLDFIIAKMEEEGLEDIPR